MIGKNEIENADENDNIRVVYVDLADVPQVEIKRSLTTPIGSTSANTDSQFLDNPVIFTQVLEDGEETDVSFEECLTERKPSEKLLNTNIRKRSTGKETENNSENSSTKRFRVLGPSDTGNRPWERHRDRENDLTIRLDASRSPRRENFVHQLFDPETIYTNPTLATVTSCFLLLITICGLFFLLVGIIVFAPINLMRRRLSGHRMDTRPSSYSGFQSSYEESENGTTSPIVEELVDGEDEFMSEGEPTIPVVEEVDDEEEEVVSKGKNVPVKATPKIQEL